ncbi:unnamed protein product, partial [Rotaria magnacalcarata]
DSLKTSSDLVQRVYEHILKECKKESLKYRSIAIRVLSLLADEYNFQVYELFWTWFEKTFKLPVNMFDFLKSFLQESISFDENFSAKLIIPHAFHSQIMLADIKKKD